MKTRLANALWTASCLPGWGRFSHAAGNVAAIQAQLLSHYLLINANADYGLEYQFASITTLEQFQTRLPLTTYDDYSPYIERMSNGEASVLTCEPVRMFELSSGSTAASKLIPYTARLKAEFQCGIAPWIFDLYTHFPSVQQGTAYWSVTPLTEGQRFTPGGLPIGFDSDSAYLGPLGQWLAEAIMAVPDGVKRLTHIDNFRYATLLSLLHRPDLRLISVWNPTFLTLLLAPLSDWWDSLCNDIAYGTLTFPASSEDMSIRFAPATTHAHRLKNINPTDYKSIWPHLALISCWADGPSAPYASQLAEKFPHVTIQGKGLLATEAFVSFPLAGIDGGVLAVTTHFFEFIDETGEVLPAHQLRKGKIYSVVVTTGGGFYRYQLHDLVEVIGFWKQAPRLRFAGKANHISDWFGEKLEERFVTGVLEKIFTLHQLTPAFTMFAPTETSTGFHYTLYLEAASHFDISTLEQDIDSALRANFHYDYCRRLGQLDAVHVTRITDGAQAYLRACRLRGQKLGNIKPSVLQKTTGWDTYFSEHIFVSGKD